MRGDREKVGQLLPNRYTCSRGGVSSEAVGSQGPHLTGPLSHRSYTLRERRALKGLEVNILSSFW